MDAQTEPGWYYVGNGRLRYRDEYGWTAYDMDTHDALRHEWPPPAPSSMLRQLRSDEAEREAQALAHSGFFRGLLRRPRSGKHRTSA